MKHKLLSILLCLAMALSLLPTAALAEGAVTYPAGVQDERELRYALYSAPVDGTQVTIKLAGDITLEMLYAAENFGTEKLEDNAAGDTFNRYKLGVHPTAEDPDHWNSLVTNQSQEARLLYGAYYHMSATDERIARLVVKAGQNIELDLNGHTIQKAARATHGDWSEVCTDIIGNYGTLTVIDSSTGETKGTIKGNGYISCVGAVLHNYEGATMTVGAVNVDGNAEGMTAGTGQYVIANDGGTITINGTNIYDTATSASLLVSTAGTMTITGNATLNHPAAKTINAKGGTVEVGDVTITSDTHAIYAAGGTTNITGNVTIKASAADKTTGTLTIDGGAITKAENVDLPAPSGSTWTKIGNTEVLVKDSSAAVVNGVGYATLAAAINAAGNDDTVTLLKDVTEAVTIPEDKTITLDLNGKTLKHEGQVLDIYGNLTIKNGTVELTSGNAKAAIWLNKAAKLTIDSDATVSVPASNFAIGLWSDCTAAELTVKGTLKGGNGLTVNGTIANPGNKVTVDGATIESEGHGIYQAGVSDIVVKNANITGATGIEVRAGKLTVDNSTISGSGEFKSEANSGGPTTDGAGIAIVQHTTNLPINVTISGGSISGPKAIYQATKQSQNTEASIATIGLSVTGGEFTGEISSENLKKFISGGSFSTDLKNTGYLADSVGAEVKSADGSTYGYYANVAAATAAAKPGDTVTDLKATTEQKVTLTLKYNDGATADITYNVASGTTITLPTPARRSGYIFNGWYDGSKFYAAGASYKVSATVTLNASWSYISSGSSSSDPIYSVSTPSKTENGTVTVSPKNASKGDTVTVTVKPDSGYVLETLTVTDKNGNELTLKDKGDGKYTFTMPASKVEIKATFVKEVETSPFSDVSTSAYYYEAVKWAQEKGITGGIGNGLFGPNQPCTRAQIVTFLWRAAGSPAPKNMSSFSDVSTDSYYAKAVAWAVENGITTGTGDGKFSPDATCTRAQSVTFLYRAMGTAPTTVNGFTDVAADSFCADAVAWAVENGVTNGTSASAFSPSNGCTRAQIVTFLFRAYQGK